MVRDALILVRNMDLFRFERLEMAAKLSQGIV
jgi:hypothetical protein